MKNKEKYILMNLGFANGTITMRTSDCVKQFKGYTEFIDWLEKEYKEPIKLTKAERVILENIGQGYKWIARDWDGYLCIYDEKPEKFDDPYGSRGWGDWDEYHSFDCYKHLFKFVKWEDEEPYNIKELLKNSEVVDA